MWPESKRQWGKGHPDFRFAVQWTTYTRRRRVFRPLSSSRAAGGIGKSPVQVGRHERAIAVVCFLQEKDLVSNERKGSDLQNPCSTLRRGVHQKTYRWATETGGQGTGRESVLPPGRSHVHISFWEQDVRGESPSITTGSRAKQKY